MTGPPRVHLMIDYQNLHLSATEAFAPPGTPPADTLIHPGRYGDVLMGRRAAMGLPGLLAEIHVFRGQSSRVHQPALASAVQAQISHWSRDPRVQVPPRPLRYPPDWPQRPAREKGVDVMLTVWFVRHLLERRADVLILASRDTDLLPALELAVELGQVRVEVTAWQGLSRLRMRGVWCTHLGPAEFVASRDRCQYGSVGGR